MLSAAKSLMVAIVKRGVADLEDPDARVHLHARAWFLAPKTEGEHLFAFTRICGVFGWDSRVIRARILRNVACEPALSLDRQPWRQPAPSAARTPAELRVVHRR